MKVISVELLIKRSLYFGILYGAILGISSFVVKRWFMLNNVFFDTSLLIIYFLSYFILAFTYNKIVKASGKILSISLFYSSEFISWIAVYEVLYRLFHNI